MSRFHAFPSFFSVSQNGNNYAYRAYLQDLLDYNDDCKQTHLSAQGWDSDHVGKFESPLNPGYVNRRARFLRYDKRNGDTLNRPPFREDAVTFIGRLRTNYENCKQGLGKYENIHS